MLPVILIIVTIKGNYMNKKILIGSFVVVVVLSLISLYILYPTNKVATDLNIQGIDYQSRVTLEHGYTKDKNFVYRYDIKFVRAHPATFVVLDYTYTKDKNAVYFVGNKIIGADSATIEPLTNGYAKDKNNVYFEGRKIDDADSESFVMVENQYMVEYQYYAKDKNAVYDFGDKIEGANPSTFEVSVY